ncbi:MAG TPA: polymorphic toxin-type HINT domain-containing protein [Pirellulaceae bacterium]|nr:polymorphic toxin-type HINT domain-containing protein [Pirellulaceae bacterium]
MCWTRPCALAASWIVLSLGVAVLPARSAEKAALTSSTAEASALVQQALDNEVAGDGASRKDLLQQAVAHDPQYPPARWQLGHVRTSDAWLPAAEAMAKGAAAELTAQYQVKRAEALDNAALELKLAQWCVKNDMQDRARLHFWRVLSNPRASQFQVKDAAKALDLVLAGGTILTRQALKGEQEREQRIADAIEKYRPILAHLQPAIDGGFGEKHDQAAQKLAAIDDPEVIPTIETYLRDHQEGFGEELVKLLAKFPQFESTQTLVRYAVVTPYLSVRERAIAELKSRPLHDYMPTLLAGLIAPIESQYQFQRDAQGNIHYQQVFVQERADGTLVRQLDQLYRAETQVILGNGNGEGARRAAFFNASVNYAIQSGIANEIARHNIQSKAAKLASNLNNESVIHVLTQVSGQQLPAKPQAWWQWWQDYNQVHYPKQTYHLYAYSVQPYVANAVGISCFVKGTTVWTEQGQRPIETVQPGDRVLAQNPDTGELCFKVVIGTTIRPPTDASKLTVNGEAITTTLGHPLWVTGKGWEMAKNLQEGDQLHGIGGIVNVNAIEPLPNKVEAHNLVVDDFNTYFVGNCGMMVHDNTYRKPTRAVVPGLVPEVAGKIGK